MEIPTTTGLIYYNALPNLLEATNLPLPWNKNVEVVSTTTMMEGIHSEKFDELCKNEKDMQVHMRLMGTLKKYFKFL